MCLHRCKLKCRLQCVQYGTNFIRSVNGWILVGIQVTLHIQRSSLLNLSGLFEILYRNAGNHEADLPTICIRAYANFGSCHRILSILMILRLLFCLQNLQTAALTWMNNCFRPTCTSFHRGGSRARSWQTPNLEPVFPVSTDKEPALNCEKWFQ